MVINEVVFSVLSVRNLYGTSTTGDCQRAAFLGVGSTTVNWQLWRPGASWLVYESLPTNCRGQGVRRQAPSTSVTFLKITNHKSLITNHK